MKLLYKIKNIFSGRVARTEYNINIIATHFVAFVTSEIVDINKNHNLVLQALTYIMFSLFLILYLQFFPLLIKRIHDINKSAWCLLYFPLIIFFTFNIIAIIFLLLESLVSLLLLSIWLPLIFLSYYIFIIILMFKKGTSGTNKYGEEPKY